MKNYKVFLYTFLILALAYSCQKFEQTQTEIQEAENTSIQSMAIPDGFDWSMTTDYDFYFNGGSGGTIQITSEDESVVYHKGTYIEDNGSYKVSLRLPATVNKVKINSILVDLIGSTIYYNLSTKSSEINYSLYFDGVNDFVMLGYVTQLDNVAAFTVEGWAKQTNNTHPEYIFSKLLDSNNDILVRTGLGSFYIEVGNGSDSYATWINYSVTIGSGSWFHWAVVYDGTGGTNADRLKLYINGNITPISLAFTGTIPSTTSASFFAQSAFLSKASSPFGGFMDEVRIWSTARSPSEISANYNQLLVGDETGLMAYYQCDEGSGTTLGDLAENYDGTISGGAVYSTDVSYATDTDVDGVDDNYDDYEFDSDRAYNNYYPAEDTGTVVFEDLWPSAGDYDFNDLVIGYQFKTVTDASNYVVEIEAYFEVRAHGAALHNGFGFQLPDAVAGILSGVVVTGHSITQSVVTVDGTTHFELGQTYPVVIVMDDVYDLMESFSNTQNFVPAIPYAPITISMTVPSGVYTEADFSLATWDPFIFVDQTRGREVHLLDYPPTDLVNDSYFGTIDDASDEVTEYYRTATGLPWALDFPSTFEYPIEYSNILYTYLYFREWAESGGTEKADWYTNTAAGYRDNSRIY